MFTLLKILAFMFIGIIFISCIAGGVYITTCICAAIKELFFR